MVRTGSIMEQYAVGKSTSSSTDDPAIPSYTSSQLTSPGTQTPRRQSLSAEKDRENTQRRYQTSLDDLEKALQGATDVWTDFPTANFSGDISRTNTVHQLQDRIEESLNRQETARANQHGWDKVKHVMKAIFVATSPFAKFLLTIAKQHSLVW
jgi:hypothetical protein